MSETAANIKDEPTDTRHYDASPLPVFIRDVAVTPGEAELIVLYEQICASWHVLIDIRFKLLGFIPAVSVALLATLLSSEGPAKGLPRAAKIMIAALGFIATLALRIYDLRNSELHDDLISRGRKIEELWGIHTGQFRGRKKSRSWWIQHDRATALIYWSALIGWAAAILVIMFGRE